MRLAGIDEAGRGAVLGPLVIAAVSADDSDIQILSSLGVKDSKLLSRKKRESLYSEIKSIALFRTIYLSPREIDHSVLLGTRRRRLNYLEIIAMAKLTNLLSPDVVFVDSPDVNLSKFTDEMRCLCNFPPEIVALHKADRLYSLVSAASIVAKVERDWAIDCISRQIGPVGSGYPSDPVTRKFLFDLVERREAVPEFSRMSWKTWSAIRETKLDKFIE